MLIEFLLSLAFKIFWRSHVINSIASGFGRLGLISILLLISHLLRNRIKLLQNIYVPSSIIAGLLGLLGGSQFLDILPLQPMK